MSPRISFIFPIPRRSSRHSPSAMKRTAHLSRAGLSVPLASRSAWSRISGYTAGPIRPRDTSLSTRSWKPGTGSFTYPTCIASSVALRTETVTWLSPGVDTSTTSRSYRRPGGHDMATEATRPEFSPAESRTSPETTSVSILVLMRTVVEKSSSQTEAVSIGPGPGEAAAGMVMCSRASGPGDIMNTMSTNATSDLLQANLKVPTYPGALMRRRDT